MTGKLDRSKLDKLRAKRLAIADQIQAEEDRLLQEHKKQQVFSREFSWLKIRTKWENTRPGNAPIRYTGDGAYGLKSALAMASHDLTWPRLDPHSRALKVEIYFDPTGKGSTHNGEDLTKMVLIATIEPPSQPRTGRTEHLPGVGV